MANSSFSQPFTPLPVDLANGGTGAALTDPNADRILFWDDSAGATDFLTAGSGLSISGTTITASGSGGTVTSVTSANSDATIATTTTTPVITIVSAPKLTTARTINGTSFDGTGNITLGTASVTLAMMADIATASVLGRNTTGTGVPEVLSATTTKSLLSLNNVENTALSTWAGTSSITTLGTITTGIWTGTTIAVASGGTGQTTYTNGQLLIGNTTGNTLTKATLTGTSNQVTVTNSTGSITLSTPQDIATASSPTFAGLNLGTGNISTMGNISMDGTANRDITVVQSAGAGSTLTLQSGQSATGGTNTAGSAVLIKANAGTGNSGAGVIQFFTATDTGSGTTTQAVSEKMRLLTSSNGRLIIGTTSGTGVSDGIGIGGNVARSIIVVRHTTPETAGNTLTVQSGGSTFAATNKSGGNLILSSGISTGSGTSSVLFKTFPGTAGSTTDNTVLTALTLDGSQNAQLVGKMTSYAGVSTVGWGHPAIYGMGRSTGQTAANASVSTYTVGSADGSFLVSANVLVTTSNAESFTVTVSYTDEGNTARTLTLNFQTIAGVVGTTIAFTNGAVPYEGVAVHLRCKASTAITIKTAAGGTYTGCTYNVEGMITQIA